MQGYEVQNNSPNYPLVFLLVLSADHVSPATGLTPVVTLSKNGAAFASPAGAVSEIANGWYKVAGNATDTGTLGPIILHAAVATADDTDVVYPVVAVNPQSATNFITSVPTVTTVTNQLTAAAIATGVWQDATAGDFTTASSVGKSLYNAFSANSSVFTIAALANGPSGSGSSPAAIATAVWQDATGSDFTTANSIGKSLYNAFTAGTSVYTTAALANAPSGGGGGITLATTLNAARAIDSIADTALTVNDALMCAAAAAAGKESVVGTAYTVKTPSTGTVLRTFTLDSGSAPSQRN